MINSLKKEKGEQIHIDWKIIATNCNLWDTFESDLLEEKQKYEKEFMKQI